MKKIISLILIAFITNGCTLAGLSVSDNIEKHLTQEEWESVNSKGIEREIK